MRNFLDRTVVITGAASGMGRAYAEAFARRGSRLGLCDVDADRLSALSDRLAAEIGADRIFARVLDVSDEGAVAGFAEAVREALGPAHVVLNNAGIGGAGQPFYTMESAVFERTVRVNFDGVVYVTRAFLPHMVARGEGALVNVSSVFGLIGPPNATDYAATKFAVRGFTEALMAEFYGSDVQIHCLHPGGIRTDIAAGSGNERFAAEKLITPPEDIVAHVIRCIERRRLKIVYGHESRRLWFAANFVPLRLFIKRFWAEARGIVDVSDYPRFNPELADELDDLGDLV